MSDPSPESLSNGENTYFAPAERAGPMEVRSQAQAICGNPIIDTLLETMSGWVAVLNEHRQILAVNHAFLRGLGIPDPAEALGLRPGEAVGCKHAGDGPGGCGTGPFCRTCGAAIAILAALDDDQPAQKECILSAAGDDDDDAHDFLVRSSPLHVGDRKIVLLSMRDISDEKRRVAMERAFLHDMANILTGLIGALEIISSTTCSVERDLVEEACQSARLLGRELQIQRMLVSDSHLPVHTRSEPVSIRHILLRLKRFFVTHPAATGRHLEIFLPEDGQQMVVDEPALMRVLINLVLNALEAGVDGDTVRVASRIGPDRVCLSVWNAQAIPESIVPRVFQRYFSTKEGPGRGMGTYAIRRLCESVLGGAVTFETDLEAGTTFYVDLPRHPVRLAGAHSDASVDRSRTSAERFQSEAPAPIRDSTSGEA